jgi:His/Glu/Gln/Arg/opine family amino acid ABC transporter permease subunit
MSLPLAFDWGAIWDNRSALLHGLRLTIEVSVLGILASLLIGLVLGVCRAVRVPVVSQLAAVYVEIFRNTPILVQIFMIFYALPVLSPHLRLTGFQTAWISVALWGGAFNTENFRAGFEAVPKRYLEAGLALGFGRLRTIAFVMFPIGGRIALPSTINTFVSVTKNTSLMTAIAFAELTSVARSISASTFRDVEMLTTVGVVYLLLVWGLSGGMRLLERRLALPEDAR